ncbi:hypothetical protein [Glutamicibacter halophytocola]|uniref:hypothetical protein n=1 Tax=Glutamicibacter halophytocola TaxID=1933880 RepID=UPI0015C537B3|nr:hypothetical protein [Glutamicibacter halophytocola]NQD41153.1 hypothetical protein [Glutamicibacter halophytocola]
MARMESAPHDPIIAVHQGVDVSIAGINLSTELPPWHLESEDCDVGFTSSFEFTLRAVPNEMTRQLDADFSSKKEAWKAQLEERGASIAGSAPPLPSDKFFERIEAEVTDDLGTEYMWVGGETASLESPWEATWIYAPAPPQEAGHLVLDFIAEGLKTGHSCTLDLRS